MKTTNNLDEAVKILRNELITQSELPSEKVLNALALTGTELDELLNDSIYNSITPYQTTMLFSLNSYNSTSDVSMESGDKYNSKYLTCSPTTICSLNTILNDFIINNDITYYKIFQLKLILYGIYSTDIALKLIARLRSALVRADLYNSGVYIESVSEPFILNEFKNDIMWLRTDVNINFGIKLAINQINEISLFNNINSLNIIKGGIYG